MGKKENAVKDQQKFILAAKKSERLALPQKHKLTCVFLLHFVSKHRAKTSKIKNVHKLIFIIDNQSFRLSSKFNFMFQNCFVYVYIFFMAQRKNETGKCFLNLLLNHFLHHFYWTKTRFRNSSLCLWSKCVTVCSEPFTRKIICRSNVLGLKNKDKHVFFIAII